MLHWYATGSADARALHSWDWHWYGGLYEGLIAVMERVSPLAPIDTRHLINAAVGLLGAWGCANLGTLVAGPQAGCWAALLLLTHPSWWGHLFSNSKDIPFATAHTWAVLGLIRLAQAPSGPLLRRAIRAGGLVGFALAIRSGGVFLLAELAAAIAFASRPTRRTLLIAIWHRARWPMLAALATAWLVMIAGWPYALVHPVSGPVTAALHAAQFPREIRFLHFGEVVSSTRLPWSYLPVSLVIRSPEVWCVLIPCGAFLMLRRGGLQSIALLASFLVPFTMILASRAPLYNGIRHVLFLLPPLACLGGAALDHVLSRTRRLGMPMRPLVRTALVGTAFVHLISFVMLHPYQYAYMNAIVTTSGGVAGRFEPDDYGHALREGWRRLDAHHRTAGPPRPGRVLVPHAGGDLAADVLPGLARTDRPRDADYLLTTAAAPPPGPAVPLFTVERLGVTLIRAYALRRTGDKILPVIPR